MPMAPQPTPEPIRTDAAGGEPSTEPRGMAAARIRFGRVLRVESGDFYLLLGTTLFLVVFGLVMVLSSSVVESRIEDGGAFVQIGRQAAFAAVGVPVMLLASRMPQRVWMLLAWPAMAVSCLMQLLVVATPRGVEVGGNTNWISIAGFQFQPSEMIKVSMVMWLGLIVTKKQAQLGDFVHGVLPILLVGGGSIGLVLLGGDLGTVMIMGAMLIGALFLVGIRIRLLIGPVLVAALLFVIVAFSSENRMKRIMSFVQESCTKVDVDACWQIQHGTFALANGGVFGVGLGNSAAKWSWLPAAANDFIFAIIGEELGLIGAIVVIAMFVLLAIAFARVLRGARTPFGKAATASVMVWVIVQACVNIGVVLRVFPVLGVPLPLVSAGGTALLTTLFAIGIVLSVARNPDGGGSGRWLRGSVPATAGAAR